jgi:hypothetical protein
MSRKDYIGIASISCEGAYSEKAFNRSAGPDDPEYERPGARSRRIEEHAKLNTPVVAVVALTRDGCQRVTCIRMDLNKGGCRSTSIDGAEFFERCIHSIQDR